MLESLVIYSCPVIVGGDISVHVEDPSNTLTAWYLDLLSSMRLQQHVTHISAGLLDHVITRTNFTVDQLDVDPPGLISDHSVITGNCRRLLQSSPPPITCIVRSWETVDRTVLRQAIADSPLGQPPPPNASRDDLFALYYQTLREIADLLALEHAVRTQQQRQCPWFDADCGAVRRACRRRERRYRRTRDDTDKAAYIASTMHKKHDVLNIKQQQYWSERVATSASNSTLLWRSMMKVLQQDKRPAENLTPTLHDADDFRQFFDEKVMQVGVSLHQHPRQRRRFLSHLVAGAMY